MMGAPFAELFGELVVGGGGSGARGGGATTGASLARAGGAAGVELALAAADRRAVR
jgi:hypothetical protein